MKVILNKTGTELNFPNANWVERSNQYFDLYTLKGGTWLAQFPYNDVSLIVKEPSTITTAFSPDMQKIVMYVTNNKHEINVHWLAELKRTLKNLNLKTYKFK